MKKCQAGFGIVEILLVLLVVGAVGVAGWYYVTGGQTKPSSSSTANLDKSFSVTIDPMVGGGLAGATDSYEITAAGEVYHFESPNNRTPATRTLVKTIKLPVVQELRDSFIDSGVLDLEADEEPKYGGMTWTVTIDGIKRTFNDQSPGQFTDPKAKLQQIFDDDLKL